MKNILLFFSLGAVLLGCGPAAEERDAMHRRAKVFQDSIANVIRMSMDEAAAPGPAATPAMVTPAPGQTPPAGAPAASNPAQPAAPAPNQNK